VSGGVLTPCPHTDWCNGISIRSHIDELMRHKKNCFNQTFIRISACERIYLELLKIEVIEAGVQVFLRHVKIYLD
jgi:hypothetical protein